MLITESLTILGHSITMSAKPTHQNLESLMSYMKRQDIQTIVPLLPIRDIFAFYGFNLIDRYEENNFNVIHYPIKDFDVPKDFPAFDSFIEEVGFALADSNILIHCSAGLGRTGLVTAALLIKYKAYDSERAINLVRKSRMGTVETREQESFLARYNYYINGVQ